MLWKVQYFHLVRYKHFTYGTLLRVARCSDVSALPVCVCVFSFLCAQHDGACTRSQKTSSKFSLRPSEQLSIITAYVCELLQISIQALPQPPLQECEICLRIWGKKSSSLFCLDSFSMLAGCLGGSRNARTHARTQWGRRRCPGTLTTVVHSLHLCMHVLLKATWHRF